MTASKYENTSLLVIKDLFQTDPLAFFPSIRNNVPRPGQIANMYQGPVNKKAPVFV